MKEKTKIKDIPEGPSKRNIRKSECDEDKRKQLNIVSKALNEMVQSDKERIEKSKSKNAMISSIKSVDKFDEIVENELNKDANENVPGDLTDDTDKSNTLGICGVGEYLNDTPVQRNYKTTALTI
ncbi:5917_t:CDS:2 [Gigaspora rosea]|nr:5917_t:CDS:2 [Gigaspora rosea]